MPVAVHRAEIVLGIGITRLGRDTVPARGLHIVLLNAVAVVEHDAEIVLGPDIAVGGGGAKGAQSGSVIVALERRHAGFEYRMRGRLGRTVRQIGNIGALIIADSVAPEDGSVRDWMEEIELRRDYSHIENRKVSAIQDLVAGRELDMVDRIHTSIHLKFNGWVARTAIPEPEAESLRRDFLNAPAAVKDAFEIEGVGEDIHFAWPCLVFRALKT